MTRSPKTRPPWLLVALLFLMVTSAVFETHSATGLILNWLAAAIIVATIVLDIVKR